jgi:hypothetical protein
LKVTFFIIVEVFFQLLLKRIPLQRPILQLPLNFQYPQNSPNIFQYFDRIIGQRRILLQNTLQLINFFSSHFDCPECDFRTADFRIHMGQFYVQLNSPFQIFYVEEDEVGFERADGKSKVVHG